MGSLWSSPRLHFHWLQYAGPFKMYWRSYLPCQTSPCEWPLRQTSCKDRTAEHRNCCLEGDILRLCKFTVLSIQVFNAISMFFNIFFQQIFKPSVQDSYWRARAALSVTATRIRTITRKTKCIAKVVSLLATKTGVKETGKQTNKHTFRTTTTA